MQVYNRNKSLNGKYKAIPLCYWLTPSREVVRERNAYALCSVVVVLFPQYRVEPDNELELDSSIKKRTFSESNILNIANYDTYV